MPGRLQVGGAGRGRVTGHFEQLGSDDVETAPGRDADVSGDPGAASYETIVKADAVLTHPGHHVQLEQQAARDVVNPGQGG